MDSDIIFKTMGVLGGITGTITLVWRLIEARQAFLQIEITGEESKGVGHRFRTVVENRNVLAARKLKSAFLVVGPQNEHPDETVRSLLADKRHTLFPSQNEMVDYVSELIASKALNKLDDRTGRSLIPLPYYYAENVDVADERLSYEQIVDTREFPPGVYSARFYILAERQLHRVVHAAFNVGSTSDLQAGPELASDRAWANKV